MSRFEKVWADMSRFGAKVAMSVCRLTVRK